MTRVAVATCGDLPELDADDRLLLPALRRRGIEAVPAVWDDPGVDWGSFALTVVRNPWDYFDRRDAFVAWARSVPRIANPAEVLAWNTDKRYLVDLQAAGIPIVPTRFVAPGEPLEWPGTETVVKPAVSGGALATARHAEEATARRHVEALHEVGRVAMVQPYLSEVDTAGETGLVYLGGAWSHAIRKGPLLVEGAPPPDEPLPQDIRARDPSPAERQVADRVVAWTQARFGELLYARVDLLPTPEGPVLIELEATEPSLFLGHAEGAAERLAEAVQRLVRRG